MATVTVDLPAHNVASSTVTVPDPECLADPSATSGIVITHPGDVVFVGSLDGTTSGNALGFGYFDLPSGATLVDCRFVGHVQRLGDPFPVPPGSWDSVVVAPVPTTGPSLAINYDDRRGFEVGHTLGYALTPTDALGEIVGDPIVHSFHFANPITEPDYDVVISGIGSPPEGAFGLCPSIVIADSNWWEFPATDHPILLTYLAIRITYTTARRSPLRRFPVDNGAHGPRRLYPPPKDRRAAGGYH